MSSEKNDAWKAQNTVRFNMRFTNSSGIPTALSKVAKDKHVPETVYIRQALIAQLIRDGYLSEESQKTK